MLQRPNVLRAKTIKFIEENTDTSLCDQRLGNHFLRMIPKVQTIREKNR